MESVIAKLERLIFEDASEEQIFILEEILKDSIDVVVDIPAFYNLPTENLINIIKRSNIKDVEIIKKISSCMNEYKNDESHLILDFIDTDEASLDEYIEIMSRFQSWPICKRIHDILKRNKTLPFRDYEGEIKDLEEKISSLQNENKELVSFLVFPNVKPKDFEQDISKAAEDGKLTSVIYHIETLKTDVETRNKYGCTALSRAALKGHLDIVRYLYEKCKADPVAKEKNQNEAIHCASIFGHFETVKYLIEKCGVDIDSVGCNGYTPLDDASSYGNLMLIKYLLEKGAKVTERIIKHACIANKTSPDKAEIQKLLKEHIKH